MVSIIHVVRVHRGSCILEKLYTSGQYTKFYISCKLMFILNVNIKHLTSTDIFTY